MQIPKPHHDLLSQKFLRWFFFIVKPENHYSISVSSSGSKELKTIEGTRPRLNVWIYGIVIIPCRSDVGSRTQKCKNSRQMKRSLRRLFTSLVGNAKKGSRDEADRAVGSQGWERPWVRGQWTSSSGGFRDTPTALYCHSNEPSSTVLGSKAKLTPLLYQVTSTVGLNNVGVRDTEMFSYILPHITSDCLKTELLIAYC